jgi:hypothetical protein
MKNKSNKFSTEVISINDRQGQPIDLLEVHSDRYSGDPENCICCGKRIDMSEAIPVVLCNLGGVLLAPWGEESRVANLGAYFFGVSCAKKIPAKFKGEAGLLPE